MKKKTLIKIARKVDKAIYANQELSDSFKLEGAYFTDSTHIVNRSIHDLYKIQKEIEFLIGG